MPSLHVLDVMTLVFAAALLVAGCVGEQAAGNQYNNTATVPGPAAVETTLPPETVPTPTQCPVSDNKTYWILTDPVGRVEKGDQLIIRGTTNIPAGESLQLAAYQGVFHPHCKCCYDDQLIAKVKVRTGGGCANTFSHRFDTTNSVPQEYMLVVEYPQTSTTSAYQIFDLLENTTPLRYPGWAGDGTDPSAPPLALFQADDVEQGDMLTIGGIRNGIAYPMIYTVRNAYADAACQPRCRDEIMSGIIHPAMYGPDSDRFFVKVDTAGLEPAMYVLNLEVVCTDLTAKMWFNVTQVRAENSP